MGEAEPAGARVTSSSVAVVTVRSVRGSSTRPAAPPAWQGLAGWRAIVAAAVESYPGSGVASARTRGKLIWSLARRRVEIQEWLADPSRVEIVEAIRVRPVLLGFFVCPYLSAAWPVERRFEAILEHHRIVGTRLPSLALPPGAERTILDLGHVADGLRVTLDRSRWFFREGDLVLNLVEGDRRLVSLAFALGSGERGLVAYVGALQGASGPDTLSVYRRLTHRLHGLRPRDLAVKIFQILAASAGVQEIRCIADGFRHQRHPYFADRLRARLHGDYDEVWREHGGAPMEEGFFVLGVQPSPRPPETVPTRKRAMYRRRAQPGR
jgi:uncharacterized protein VirK/YbjX